MVSIRWFVGCLKGYIRPHGLLSLYLEHFKGYIYKEPHGLRLIVVKGVSRGSWGGLVRQCNISGEILGGYGFVYKFGGPPTGDLWLL